MPRRSLERWEVGVDWSDFILSNYAAIVFVLRFTPNEDWWAILNCRLLIRQVVFVNESVLILIQCGPTYLHKTHSDGTPSVASAKDGGR
jgi:hypothetical protein